MTAEITHDAEGGRFVTELDGQRAELGYRAEPGGVRIDHVTVPAAIEGRGIAGALTRHALDWARREGFVVTPRCPYVAAWIARHPEYADLVAR
jgi:uncharacterized protein